MKEDEKNTTLFFFRADKRERHESIDLVCLILQAFRDTYMITEKGVTFRDGKDKFGLKRQILIDDVRKMNSFLFKKNDVEYMLSFIIKTFGVLDSLVEGRGEEFIFELERICLMLSNDFRHKEDFTKSSLEIQRVLLTAFSFYFNFAVNVIGKDKKETSEEDLALKRRQKAGLMDTFLDNGILSIVEIQESSDNIICFLLEIRNSYGKRIGSLHLFGNRFSEDKLILSELFNKRKRNLRGEEHDFQEAIEFLEINEEASETIRRFDFKYALKLKEDGVASFEKKENEREYIEDYAGQ